MRVHDISTPIASGMATFPGDPAVEVRSVRSVDRGDPYSLSVLSMGSHTGTHVDPPCHFVRGGTTIDRVDPARLNGPCRVVRVADSVVDVGAEAFEDLPPGTERVLLRTRNSTRWLASDAFFPDYVALTEAGAGELLRRGVRLVGIDALSIERDPSGRFPVHHALLGSGALIVEGLRLGEAAAGVYELRCLPLRLAKGDGGPARALLVEE